MEHGWAGWLVLEMFAFIFEQISTGHVAEEVELGPEMCSCYVHVNISNQ